MQPRTLRWIKEKSAGPGEPTFDMLEGLQHKQSSYIGTEWIFGAGCYTSSTGELTRDVGFSFSNQHEMEIPYHSTRTGAGICFPSMCRRGSFFCSGNEHTVPWVLFWSFMCLNINFPGQNLFLLTQIQLPLIVPCNRNFFTMK